MLEIVSSNRIWGINDWFGMPDINRYFARLSMKRAKKIYNLAHLLSAVGMILALLWLTVSTPLVYAAQQNLAKYSHLEKAGSFPETEEDSTNPFGNNTEEKAPSGTNLSEEYLHDHHVQFHFFATAVIPFAIAKDDTYHAFHGELLVPPPNTCG